MAGGEEAAAAALRPMKKYDTVIMCFGRFQPPTIGHKAMIDEMVGLAAKEDGRADVYVFTSKTNNIDNPLNAGTKIALLRTMVPAGVQVIHPEEAGTNNPYAAVYWLADAGYKKLVFVCGSDRASGYSDLLAKVVTIPTRVVHMLERDPDAEEGGVAAIRGTDMRKWAMSEKPANHAKFAKGLNESIRGQANSLRELIQLQLGKFGTAGASKKKSKAGAKKGGGAYTRRVPRRTRRVLRR